MARATPAAAPSERTGALANVGACAQPMGSLSCAPDRWRGCDWREKADEIRLLAAGFCVHMGPDVGLRDRGRDIATMRDKRKARVAGCFVLTVSELEKRHLALYVHLWN